jgi:hypothetical protein
MCFNWPLEAVIMVDGISEGRVLTERIEKLVFFPEI